MAPEYTLHVARLILLLAVVVLLLPTFASCQVLEEVTAKSRGRIELPFELCQSPNKEKPTDLADLHKLVRTCKKLDEHDKQYPVDLIDCVCGLFIDKSNGLYWYSHSDPLVDQVAKAVAKNMTGPFEPEGLFVDHYHNWTDEDLEQALSERTQIWSNITFSSPESIVSRSEIAREVIRLKAKFEVAREDLGIAADLASTSITSKRCKKVLRNELLDSIWAVFDKFHDLTGNVHFGRGVFQSTDKSLRDLLFQLGFCKSTSLLFRAIDS